MGSNDETVALSVWLHIWSVMVELIFADIYQDQILFKTRISVIINILHK